jgi:AcrR family transcriptional regulator
VRIYLGIKKCYSRKAFYLHFGSKEIAVTQLDTLLESTIAKLNKAIGHLEISYGRTLLLGTNPDLLSEHELAEWESLTARFSRVAELFLQRYLRTWILQRDPGFQGSFRDFLNMAEKFGLIESVDPWLSIREMRNKMAHEYEDERLARLFPDVRNQAPLLISIKKIINK